MAAVQRSETARRGRLGFNQLAPNGMHGNPIERFVERRQQPDDVKIKSVTLAKHVQRPGAILARTPGEDARFLGLIMGISAIGFDLGCQGANAWRGCEVAPVATAEPAG